MRNYFCQFFNKIKGKKKIVVVVIILLLSATFVFAALLSISVSAGSISITSSSESGKYNLNFSWSWTTLFKGSGLTSNSCPSNFQIQLDNNNDFSSPVFDDTTSASNPYNKNLVALTSGVTYYWRIRVLYDGTWSNWANGESFMIPLIDINGSSPVELDDLVSLTWGSIGASSCSASGDWNGSKSTSGSESIVKPRGNYSFTLTCSGIGPISNLFISDTANINVIQIPRCSFSANPTSIVPPQTSTISWDCRYPDGGNSANSCSIDQGIGSVSSSFGSLEIRPTETTAFNLVCQGIDGTRNFNASVNIDGAPTVEETLPR